MMKQYWNDGWDFIPEFNEGLLKKDWNSTNLQQVRLPHTVVETPFHYFEPSVYEMISGYRKVFFAPAEWKRKHVFLTFEGAAQEATIYVNGEEVMVHRCGYTAFSFELSKYLKYETDNVLTVKLDSRECLNQPPFGGAVDYMTYGGIYRDVYIEVRPEYYLEKIDFEITRVMEATKIINVEISLTEGHPDYKIKQTLLDIDGRVVVDFSPISTTSASYGVTDVELWSPKNPKLYQLKTELFCEGELVDEQIVRLAFRKAEFRTDGFYINGKKFKIRGINRHQSFPYVGYAMPERVQKRDVDILMDELGVNAVRTSHYPQSQYFLDACDERGLLVFTEIPGWQHIGDEEWKEIACENVKEMVEQNKHHPSVILWGVRINESGDDDKFYKKTNKIAHEADATRQTGGVRNFPKSRLLEDVYTFNDFTHYGRKKVISEPKKVMGRKRVPYMITEFNGHMFPTKTYDAERIRIEHALRTARVMNAYYADSDIAGGFGWCMFDYNTHKNFGSGDQICYHGAMDMFRNPKLNAAVYKSQQDKTPVLEISSAMDIGEAPACYMGTVYAFTNADSVRLYKGEQFVKEFFPKKDGEFSALPHPPIEIDDLIGEALEKGEKISHRGAEKLKSVMFAMMKYGMVEMPAKYKRQMRRITLTKFITMNKALGLYYKYMNNWGGKEACYRFEAIKNGEVVQTVVKEVVGKVNLCLETDTDVLVESNSYDVASVRIALRDQNDNYLPFANDPVMLEVEGDIQLIGPNMITLQGGVGGTYIKSLGRSGEGTLRVTMNNGMYQEIRFSVLA
ncbi:MAG: glycoside hydrolase family 2 protein [Lachnospiraceae bacterium]|nr:glycoside hydrolase family 2 protein [Lachnospiraceae bacterium]